MNVHIYYVYNEYYNIQLPTAGVFALHAVIRSVVCLTFVVYLFIYMAYGKANHRATHRMCACAYCVPYTQFQLFVIVVVISFRLLLLHSHYVAIKKKSLSVHAHIPGLS